jgi:LEA14-like dessication related protein
MVHEAVRLARNPPIQKKEQSMKVAFFSLPVLAILLLGGCSSLATPTASVVGVHFTDLSIQSVTMAFDVEIGNPYSVPLPLSNLDYGLTTNSAKFLSGDAKLQGTVPANDKKVVQVPVKITFAELLKAAQGVRLGSVVPYSAELGLSVDAPIVGKLRVPLKKEGQLPIPTTPDIEVAEVKWGDLSLSQATGTIKLNVVNRNQFAMDLSKMSYAFSLGDVEVAKSSLAKPVSFAAGGGAGTIEIPLSVSAQQAGLGVLRMLTGSGASYKFAGSADLNTPFGPISVPLDKSGNCSFKR